MIMRLRYLIAEGLRTIISFIRPLKLFHVYIAEHVTSYYEDPSCPNRWRESGCYDIEVHARDTVTDRDVTISSVYEAGARNPDWLNEIFERLCNMTELVYQMVKDHDIDTSKPFCRSSDQSFEWSEDPGTDFTVFDGLAVSENLKVQLVFPKVREGTEDGTRLDEFIRATDNIRGSSFKTTARDANPYMIMYTGFETGWTKTFKSTKA